MKFGEFESEDIDFSVDVGSLDFTEIYRQLTAQDDDTGTVDFDELKKFDAKNLQSGREQVEDLRANYESEQAALAYKILIDEKEELVREIADKQEKLAQVNERLKLFDKPKQKK